MRTLIFQTNEQESINKIFGTINPPISGLPTEPQEGINKIVGFGIRAFLIFAALVTLVYLFWGSYDWITSGGDKEKVSKARQKITNALIGLILTVAMLALFNLVAGDILKIIPNWSITLPQLK